MWLLKWPSGRADDAFIDLHRSDRLSPSGDDAIKFHVIFERACACGVIIIGRSKPHQNAGGLIDLAGNGHEAVDT